MRHSHFLAISFFLFGALLFLPLKANAGTIETVETIFDVVHTADSSVPSGSDIEPLIRCLADKGSNVGACAEAAGAEGPYLDTVVQLYEAVTADNFGQIVGITYQWLKEDAPCIIMDILTGGTAGSLCDLVKEVVEALANVGKAVLEFFADVGAAVGEAVQDVGCAIGLGGCDKSSPPDQLAYAWVYAPKIGDAVAARESSDPAAYSNLLKALRAQASSKPAQLNIDLPAGFKLEFPDWAVTNAEKVFAQVVTQYWDADMVKSPGGILWAIETKRGEYFNDKQVIQSLAAESLKHEKPSNWIWNKCIDDFRNGFGLVTIDNWIGSVSSSANVQAVKAKALNNSQWCSNVFAYKHKPNEFAAIFRQYVADNLCPRKSNFVCSSLNNYNSCGRIMREITWEAQKECTLAAPGCDVFGDKFYCKTTDTYDYCQKWAASEGVSSAAKCGLDTSELGPQAAYRVKKALIDAGSQYASACTIDGKKSGAFVAVPASENLASVAPQAGTGKKENSKKSSAASIQKSNAASKMLLKLPKTGPSVLDCSRPMLSYICGKKYSELYGNLNLPEPLVNCTVTEDLTYAAIHKQVNDTVAKLNENGQFFQNEIDPLLVIPRTFGQLVEEEKKKTNYFTNPTPQKTFVFSRSKDLGQPIDGFSTPTMYFDAQGPAEQAIKDKSKTGVSVESRTKNALQNMKTGGGNPVKQTTNNSGMLKNQVVMNQNMKDRGMANVGTNAQTQQVRSGTVNVREANGPAVHAGLTSMRSTSIENFARSAAAWKSAAPIQAAPRGCSCSSLVSNISTLDQRSAALVKEGEALNLRTASGRMNQADVKIATQRLEEITKELNNNLAQRNSLVSQYNTALQKSTLRRPLLR